MATARAPFPYEPEEFAGDSRVSYSKVARTYLLEDENGIEWEWLPAVKKWTQTISEEDAKQQAEAYKVAGVDEDAPAFNPAKKRKEAELEDPETNPKGSKTGPGTTADANDANDATNANDDAKDEPAAKRNSAIYVTGLPLDADKEEVRIFFQKFGLIARSPDTGEWRIKMYVDDDGQFKGEALIIFFSHYSVPQAKIYNGQPFRLGDSVNMSIEEADTSYKKHTAESAKADAKGAKSKASRAKAKALNEEMKRRTATWDSDEEEVEDDNIKAAEKFYKVVIIKKAFSLNDLEEDDTLYDDVREDMKEAAEDFGKVKNVTVFDNEPAGVVTIRFAEAAAARECAEKLNGRAYNGRNLVTSLDSGKTRFRKKVKTEEQKEAEEKKRIEEYSKYIEQEN